MSRDQDRHTDPERIMTPKRCRGCGESMLALMGSYTCDCGGDGYTEQRIRPSAPRPGVKQ